ncbi:MAG: ABC transporter ATP-binding protein [Anaerolineae bacterium]|nr:ABC transporter ATP-binding protein [Anaerolineae bacterium]
MRIPLRQYWTLLADYIRPQQRRVLMLAMLLLGSIALQAVNPQIMRYFIDAARSGATDDALLRSALLFIMLAVAQQGAAVGAAYLGENVGWTSTNALRSDLARHCLHLDMSFHNRHTPGEMIERVDGDVTSLSNFFSQFTIQLLGNALLLLVILGLLFQEDWRVGLVLTGFVVLAMAVLNRLRGIAVPQWHAAREASAELFGFLEERLAGTEDIRSAGAKAYVMRRFYELMRRILREHLRAGLMTNVMINTSTMIFVVGNALALAVGAYVYQAGLVTIGTVYLIFNYTNLINRPIQRISQQLEDLQRASAGITRIRELFATEATIVEHGTSLLPPGPLSVEFDRVSFSYDADEPVLGDLSFRLEPGRVMGLLGRTGSGKTTISRLLFRLYEPQEGTVRLGGVDIRDLPLAELRRGVGMVTQNVQLFHASLRDNLTFFDRGISDESILRVIGELGLQEWFESLPEGLDTEIESGGSGLSSGEAQLLAFTRIFLKDPGLIVLDEASSRLDPATEQLIERAVERLLKDRTGVIIAHRLGTVLRADEIMIIEEGRILEHGDREVLAADPGSRFSGLLKTGLEEVLA